MYVALIILQCLLVPSQQQHVESKNKILTSKVTFIAISDDNEIVISWQDHAQILSEQGKEIKAVKVIYGIAGKPETNVEIYKWRFELGLVISDLDINSRYFLFIEYMGHMKNPQTTISCFPFFIILKSTETGCITGVYDVIMKSQPTNKINASALVEHVPYDQAKNDFFSDIILADLKDDDSYQQFCLLMAEQDEQPLWMKFSLPDAYFLNYLRDQVEKEVDGLSTLQETVNNLMGSEKPSGYDFKGKAGFYVGDKGVVVGLAEKTGEFETFFGIGFGGPPFTGLLVKEGSKTVISKPMAGVLLGRKSLTFHGPGELNCSEYCGPGRTNITEHCPIPYNEFKEYFCTGEVTVGSGKECNRRNCGEALRPAEIINIRGLNLTALEVTWEYLPKWFREAGIKNFELQILEGTIEIALLDDNPAESTSRIVSGLANDKQYNFTLRTFTGTGSFMVASEMKSFTILSKVFDIPDTIPDIVVFKNNSHNSMMLKWNTTNTYSTWFYQIILFEVAQDKSLTEKKRMTLPSNGSDSYVFTDLKIFQLYRVEMQHLNDIGFSGKNETEAKTDEYPPSQAPRNLLTSFRDSKTMHLGWGKLNPQNKNGIILGYKIRVNLLGYDVMEYNVEESESSFLLENLEEYSLYNVSVTAYNSKGESPSATSLNLLMPGSVPDMPLNLSAFNTSDLSINVSWRMTDLMWNHVPEGFLLYYAEEDDPFNLNALNLTYENLTSVNGSYFCNPPFYMITVDNLKPYMKYMFNIKAYNKEGVGKSTERFTVSTEEQEPLVPPKNLKVVNEDLVTSKTIKISWSKLSKSDIFGIGRGWTICWLPIYTEEHITVGPLIAAPGVSQEYLMKSHKYTRNIQTERKCIHVPTSLMCTITDLIGYTEYNITVAFNTKFQGVFTEPLVVTTKEDTPLNSVYQIRCETMSPTQIRLNWVLAPLAYTRGARKTYDINYYFDYHAEKKVSKETNIPGDSTSLYVGNLEPWTQYDFSIILSTGYDGVNATQLPMNSSISKMSCRTDPSVPVESPDVVNATSFESPHTSTVIWSHIGRFQWKGEHKGYTVKYRKVTVGSEPVFDNNPKELVLKLENLDPFLFKGKNFSKIILDLEVFTKYELRVAARTQKGVGVWSAAVRFETCNTVTPVIPVYYNLLPPYVGPPLGSSPRPSGVLIEIFEKSIITCSKTCQSFSSNTTLKYMYREDHPLKLAESALFFPHSATGKIDPNFDDLVLTYSPGFTLIERPHTEEETTIRNELLFIEGIKDLLPLIVFYFLVNGLFGCIFFFVERQNVSYQKRGKSFAGMFEGLYLAIATSTTVGYGDKIPLSAFGRCYMVLWTLIGLVLTGIVIGALSSALTVASKNSHKYPNERTAAVKNSLAYKYAEKHFNQLDKDIDLNASAILHEIGKTDSDLRYGLFESKEVEFELKELLENYSLVVHGTYSFQSPLGAIAFDETKKLTKCAEDVATFNYNLVDIAFEILRNSQNQLSSHSIIETKSQPLVQWNAPIFQSILLMLCITFIVCCCIGIVYELIRRRILCRKARARIRPESREKVEKELQEMKDLLEDFEEEFDKLKTTMAREGQDIIYKHGEEVLYLFSELKRFSGVDLKYAKESDLVLPLRQILAMKEDHLKQQERLKKEKAKVSVT